MLFPSTFCRNQIENDGSFSGQQVACPHCQRPFVMPTVPGVSVPIPPPQVESRPTSGIPPIQDSSPQINVGSFSATVSNRFKPANSIFDAIFDFGFKRYVTPIIVRFTWIIAIIMTMIYTLLLLWGTIAKYMPEKKTDRSQIRFDVGRLEPMISSGSWGVISDFFMMMLFIGLPVLSRGRLFEPFGFLN